MSRIICSCFYVPQYRYSKEKNEICENQIRSKLANVLIKECVQDYDLRRVKVAHDECKKNENNNDKPLVKFDD